MKRFTAGAGLVLSLALMGVAAPSALARPLTLRYTAVSVSDHAVDNPPLNASPDTPTPGDVDVFTERLLAGARVAGRDAGVCTVTDASHALCNVTLVVFGRGTIVLNGMASFNARTFGVAVLGGTGQFAGRRGSALVHDVSDTRTALTIHLL